MAGRRKQVVSSNGGKPDSDALAEVLDTDQLIAQIRYHLGMKQVKEDGETKMVLRSNALLNQNGIESVVGFVRGMVDKNQALSIYNDEQIVAMMRDLHKTVAFDLTQNWAEYDVGTASTYHKVVELVTNNCWSILNRARDGRTLDAVTESAEQRIEKVDEEQGSRWPF